MHKHAPTHTHKHTPQHLEVIELNLFPSNVHTPTDTHPTFSLDQTTYCSHKHTIFTPVYPDGRVKVCVSVSRLPARLYLLSLCLDPLLVVAASQPSSKAQKSTCFFFFLESNFLLWIHPSPLPPPMWGNGPFPPTEQSPVLGRLGWGREGAPAE